MQIILLLLRKEKGKHSRKNEQIVPGVDEACFSEFFEPRLMERPIRYKI
jgi:hypothetical protein